MTAQGSWAALDLELAKWADANRTVELWWRDDDAVGPTPALDRLFNLAAALALPVHLAIIPKNTGTALSTAFPQAQIAVPLVHGWTHLNTAPAGSKKSEFGHERPDAGQDLHKALHKMQSLYGARLLPLFVPPWNRIAPQNIVQLAAIGYSALSTYTPRSAREIAGVTQINTHIDPIAWRMGGGLADPADQIAHIVQLLRQRRTGESDAVEPMGFLTHHLVHDADIWDFTHQCLSRLLDGGATPQNLFHLKDTLP